MDLNLSELKKAAALRAVEYIQPGMIVGLGSGSTAEFATRELALRVSNGLQILGVPTSNHTASLARQLRIPLTTLHHHPRIDITIDGADEVLLDPSLSAIKGLGGALLREKIVALATHLQILIVDHTKVVQTLGQGVPLPVEVVPFGWERTSAALSAVGCHTQRRLHKDRRVPYLTDSRHYLIDCKFPSIQDPPALAAQIKAITGVVEHGLFLNIASRLVIAHPHSIQIVDKNE